jgi:hypothetical protein
MSEYEEILKSMTLTPEQKARRDEQAREYSAKRDPILEKLMAGEITRDEALDLLTEIKGGGDHARFFANQLLSRVILGEKFE